MPLKRLLAALVAAMLAAVALTATVSAQWPTSCVALNDIVEAHLGNHGNVGIYQRTFPNPSFAEDRCQNDHRADVHATFAWAIRLVPYTPTPSSGSGWPETCVQLNDIVEAHLGNHGNVGIYQRAYGYSAATAWTSSWTNPGPIQGFRWTLTGPTSRSGGGPSNGGRLDLTFNDLPPGSYTFTIRSFNAGGDGPPAFANFIIEALPSPQAEANCRNDHRADVQATFAWALGTSTSSPPPPASTPAPTPATPAGSVPTAPRNLSIEPLDSVNRSDDVRARADPPADGGGLPLQGYRWHVTGATTRTGTVASSGGALNITLYDLTVGEHTFTVRAFNHRGDGPPASISFTVTPPRPRRDPLFQEAIDLLRSRVVPVQPNLANILETTRDVPIVFGAVRSGAHGSYRRSTRTITISPDDRNRSVESLAIILAHELVHASDHINGRLFPHYMTEECFAAEVRAYKWSAAVTVALGRRSDTVDHWRAGTLDLWVRNDPLYQEQCAA